MGPTAQPASTASERGRGERGVLMSVPSAGGLGLGAGVPRPSRFRRLGFALARELLDQHEERRDEEDRDAGRGEHADDDDRAEDLARHARPRRDAVQSGTQPRMNAKDVIRIGRSRSFAPSSAASTRPMPFLRARALANSTIRIAFFAARPISMTRPICAVDVEVEAAQQEAEEGAEDRDRHGEQDAEGQRPALVERGEDQEHEDDREGEDPPRRARGSTSW